MAHSSGREKELLYLQEVFRGQIDAEVIYLILTESNFEGDSIYS